MVAAQTGMFKRRVIGILLIGVAVLFLAGFADESLVQDSQNSTANQTSAAIGDFWKIYHGNEYDQIPRIQNELAAAIQNDPNNPTLHALLGATHFWHLGEAARDPIKDDPTLADDMGNAVDLFAKALQLDYYSSHPIGYINDDHLPGYLGITTFHLGQQRNDPSLMAKGDQILDFAIYQFPEFNNFNRWAAHLYDSRDSDSYKKGLNSLWLALDNCVGKKIDRTNPDIGPYLNMVTDVGRKKACWWENNIAPYAFEGIMLNLGNGLVKAGQVEQAKIVFNNARYAKNYALWPYKQYLEQEISSNLYARSAMYADNDPVKDPPLTVPNRSCSYCHATVLEHDKPSVSQMRFGRNESKLTSKIE
jgi:hypothetical protein